MKRALFLVAAIAAAVGCRGESFDAPPILVLRNMWHQPRYNPQSASGFFLDRRTMRMPVEGTVSREGWEDDERVAHGREGEGDVARWVLAIPQAAVDRSGGMPALVRRGRERYDIFCAPCHDRSGAGNGTVVQRGFNRPPSLHEDRIRHMPDGQLYATIANGVRMMPSYAAQVPVQDRWAIVAYVRALELVQAAREEKK